MRCEPTVGNSNYCWTTRRYPLPSSTVACAISNAARAGSVTMAFRADSQRSQTMKYSQKFLITGNTFINAPSAGIHS